MSTGAGAISMSSTETASFGAITTPATDVTAADIFVTVINDAITGYTLAAHRDTVTYTQGISLMKGATTAPTGTTFTSAAGSFAALTNSAVTFASRATGATPVDGDVFSVSLRLPTVVWQRAAASATIGVITFTAVAT